MMKKHKNLLLLASLIALLGIFIVLLVFFWDRGVGAACLADILILVIPMAVACCCAFLILRKRKILPKLLVAANAAALCLLLMFGAFFLLAAGHPYSGNFSLNTNLFHHRNVLVIVPHQDDDINLMGGLIEQYTQAGSEVTVLFTTNGDGGIRSADTRAAEAVDVLTALGVKQENIYYFGFGDLWEAQDFDGTTVRHIYNSPDPDAVWTSIYGATATYGTSSIPCYLELPYTRSSYLFCMESIIQDLMPDTIFAVDSDTHLEHRSADLFFEEALGNVLERHPDYHPTVYKGFCYGTAWNADEDYYDGLNLLSTKKPDAYTWRITAFGYTWEDRLRFPETTANLNAMLLNNSVYRAFNGYGSQYAYIRAHAVLNGDKVFWQRRTDSLIYDAQIFAGDQPVSRLNDFKLKDFSNLFEIPETASGTVLLTDSTLRVELQEAVTAGCVYLYDNPDENHNILEGIITFSDGSQVAFGGLNKDGSATVIPFPSREIEWFEITATGTEGEHAGLCEVELYHEAFDTADEDAFLMAVDSDDNFVYDYIIPEGDTAALRLYRFPYGEPVGQTDVTIRFESNEQADSCHWDGDTLLVTCAEGSSCSITVSDGDLSTTFSVSNPNAATRTYLKTLRGIEELTVGIRYLVFGLHQVINRIIY